MSEIIKDQVVYKHSINPEIKKLIKKILVIDPNRRPSAQDILQDKVFRNISASVREELSKYSERKNRSPKARPSEKKTSLNKRGSNSSKKLLPKFKISISPDPLDKLKSPLQRHFINKQYSGKMKIQPTKIKSQQDLELFKTLKKSQNYC